MKRPAEKWFMTANLLFEPSNRGRPCSSAGGNYADTGGFQIYFWQKRTNHSRNTQYVRAQYGRNKTFNANYPHNTYYRTAGYYWHRSEERRVGKECRSRRSSYHK